MPRPPARRDSPLLLAAIFLIGAPIGLLLDMVQQSRQGVVVGLLCAVLSGATSVAWAYTFIRRRWWVLPPAVVGSLLLPQCLVWLAEKYPVLIVGAEWPVSGRLVMSAGLSVLFIALGFTAFVVHLRSTERRSARALAELELAGEVHRTLVPPIAATTPFAEVYGRSQASSSMGGDLIDLIVAGTHADIILGDVSGHGVNAGVVMAMLKSSLRTSLQGGDAGLHGGADLAGAVTNANRVLAELTAPNMFATLAALRVRPSGDAAYTLAGHLPLMHYRAGAREWVEHANERLPLGIDGGEAYSQVAVRTAAGDLLILLTDGLTEVQNAAGAELGLTGVRAILHSGPVEAPLAALHAHVLKKVAEHGKAGDDQSLLLVRIV